MEQNDIDEFIRDIDFDKIKQESIIYNEKYLNEVSHDYQLGLFVGQDVFVKYIPTLSVDAFTSYKIIKVSEEDEIVYKELNDIWYKNTNSKEKWNTLSAFSKQLHIKYLPKILKCYIDLIRIDNMEEFKKGFVNTLWNTDVCNYSLEYEDILITHDLSQFLTIIELKLDVN